MNDYTTAMMYAAGQPGGKPSSNYPRLAMASPGMVEIITDNDGDPYVPACGCKVPKVADPVDACDKLMMLAQATAQAYGVNPPTIFNRNENRGVAIGFTGAQFVGGLLRTDNATFQDDDVAGTVIAATFSGTQLSRLYSCQLLQVWATISPGTTQGGQLLIQSMDAEVTMTINGDTVGPFSNVVLGQISAQPNGDRQAIDLQHAGIFVPPSATVEFSIKLLDTLQGAVGETSNVRFMVSAGVPGNGHRFVRF